MYNLNFTSVLFGTASQLRCCGGARLNTNFYREADFRRVSGLWAIFMISMLE